MRNVLGAGFGLLVLGAVAAGLVRWTLNGAEEWYVGQGNGRRTVDPIIVRTDADPYVIADEILWRAKE